MSQRTAIDARFLADHPIEEPTPAITPVAPPPPVSIPGGGWTTDYGYVNGTNWPA